MVLSLFFFGACMIDMPDLERGGLYKLQLVDCMEGEVGPFFLDEGSILQKKAPMLNYTNAWECSTDVAQVIDGERPGGVVVVSR